MMEYFLLIIGAMFVNNFVLSQFLDRKSVV